LNDSINIKQLTKSTLAHRISFLRILLINDLTDRIERHWMEKINWVEVTVSLEVSIKISIYEFSVMKFRC